MSEFKLCRVQEMQPQSMRRFEVGDTQILLVRLEEEFHALQDRCSHEEFPLSDGFIDDEKVICPMHGAAFDPSTGDALTLPAYEGIRTFKVLIRDNTVYVEI